MDVVQFQEKLREICDLGKQNGNLLTHEQIRELMLIFDLIIRDWQETEDLAYKRVYVQLVLRFDTDHERQQNDLHTYHEHSRYCFTFVIF